MLEPVVTWAKTLFWGTLKTADEEGNVVLGPDAKVPAAGNPHYTISERLAEMRSNGSTFACYACKALTVLARAFGSRTTDHCTDSMKGMPRDIPSDG